MGSFPLQFGRFQAVTVRNTSGAVGKGYRVVLDVTVDAGWHGFLEYTEDYLAFCNGHRR
jgi:hypothetical protein